MFMTRFVHKLDVVCVVLISLVISGGFAQADTVSLPVASSSITPSPAAPSPAVPSTRPADTANPADRPIIQVNEPVHDFGELWAGAAVEHKFKVTNAGKSELQITNIKPSCGCTVAGEYSRTLAPGASELIPMTLQTANINGPFSKDITVSSNDPGNPTLKLILKGTANPRVKIESKAAYFGSVFGGQTRTRVVPIENNSPDPLKMVLDPMSSANGFSFELKELEVGRVYELVITLAPDTIKPGLARQEATLLTNIAAQHEIKIMATATVRDRVEAEPGSLVIPVALKQPASAPAHEL